MFFWLQSVSMVGGECRKLPTWWCRVQIDIAPRLFRIRMTVIIEGCFAGLNEISKAFTTTESVLQGVEFRARLDLDIS